MRRLSGVVLNLIARTAGKNAFRSALNRMKSRGRIERVIFVCTGNICRSPYAEAVFRKATDGEMVATSCGLSTTPGKFADKTAQKIASERGNTLGPHRTTRFDSLEITEKDLLVVMDEQHLLEIKKETPHRVPQVVFLGAFNETGPLLISDPWGKSDEIFRECFDQIEAGVTGLLTELSR